MSAERKLPDDQNKVPDDADEEDTDLMTMERAENLAQQYESIKDRTVDENTVLGKLKDIDTSRNNDRIIVTIDLPAEDSNKQFRFRKPKVWTDEYEFVRWIQHYGYDADSFPSMLRDDCRVKVQREGTTEYDLYVPEKSTPIRTRVRTTLAEAREWYPESQFYASAVLAVGWLLAGIAFASGLVGTGLGTWQTVGLWFIGAILAVIGLYLDDSAKTSEASL